MASRMDNYNISIDPSRYGDGVVVEVREKETNRGYVDFVKNPGFIDSIIFKITLRDKVEAMVERAIEDIEHWNAKRADCKRLEEEIKDMKAQFYGGFMKITLSAKEVERRRDLKKKANEGCNKCPCCNETSITAGLHYYITKGFFIPRVYNVDVYICRKCGARWESEPYSEY